MRNIYSELLSMHLIVCVRDVFLSLFEECLRKLLKRFDFVVGILQMLLIVVIISVIFNHEDTAYVSSVKMTALGIRGDYFIRIRSISSFL